MDARLFNQFREQLDAAGLPALGREQRDGVRSCAQLNRMVDQFAETSRLPAPQAELLRALVFLWHDHLEASHELSQNIANADGSFIHGIMHRREPDYGNAKYWFRRVGNHPAFGEIAKRVEKLADASGQGIARRLIRNGDWDAFAFIDACERVAGKPASDPEQQFLREVQRVEFDVLLKKFSGVAG